MDGHCTWTVVALGRSLRLKSDALDQVSCFVMAIGWEGCAPHAVALQQGHIVGALGRGC